MSLRIFSLPLLLLFMLLAGCGRDDPLAALEATVRELQDNLQEKKTSAVLDQLHPGFTAQQEFDHDWARRTMTLLFLRHKNVKVLALSSESRIDPVYRDKGHTEALVALTGAEGLIPDSARHYSVKLEWWLEDGEWRLARMSWE